MGLFSLVGMFAEDPSHSTVLEIQIKPGEGALLAKYVLAGHATKDLREFTARSLVAQRARVQVALVLGGG